LCQKRQKIQAESWQNPARLDKIMAIWKAKQLTFIPGLNQVLRFPEDYEICTVRCDELKLTLGNLFLCYLTGTFS
jgi:hypothetical protein